MNKDFLKASLLSYCQRLTTSSDGVVVRKYRNWKGEVSLRTILPIQTYFEKHNEFHGDNAWILLCWDFDKQEFRDYSLFDFINE